MSDALSVSSHICNFHCKNLIFLYIHVILHASAAALYFYRCSCVECAPVVLSTSGYAKPAQLHCVHSFG